MKRWFALQKEDEMRFLPWTAQCRMSPPKQRSRQKCHPFSTEVMTLRVKTDTKDGSIEKVTEAQECNRSSEQDVTVLRG